MSSETDKSTTITIHFGGGTEADRAFAESLWRLVRQELVRIRRRGGGMGPS